MKNLDYLLKLDKNSFWKKLRALCKNRRPVEIEMKKLKEVYFKQFNERVNSNVISNDSTLINFKIAQKDVKYDYKIEQGVIQNLVENLPNGKSSGLSGVTYEMLKYSSSKHIFEYLTLLFEKMIQYQQVPYLFNISILKPIIKDTKKPNNDLNNLRPVAISDAISNLELERNYTDHEKQFGFKKNSSCNHALFTLKQAIRLSNFTKNRLYVCAIDASKAFDSLKSIERNYG